MSTEEEMHEKSGLIFDPKPSDDLKGHFKTYLEMINCSPDDLPKYTPQQMSDLGRCSICKNWHFFKQPRSRDTKDCCIRKCSCKSC